MARRKQTSTTTTPPPPATVDAVGTVLWSANHDDGTLGAWYAPQTAPVADYGGGEYNDPGGTSVASTAQQHSGTHAAKLTLDATTNGSDRGVRLFRWREPHSYREAYYEAWYYVPVALTMTQSGAPPWPYCILMELKSKNQAGTRNDPFWLLQLKPPPHTGSLRLQLYWWGNMSPAAGPHSAESGGRAYDQALDLPVGRWVRLRWWLRQSTAGRFDGALRVWQDDTLIYDLGGVGDALGGIRTGYDNTVGVSGTCSEWACTLYSNGLSPLPATIYVDDARIWTP